MASTKAPGPSEASNNEGVQDKNPKPPTELGAVHVRSYNIRNLQKTGSSEDQAGEPENMGSWTEERYSPEQQDRLGIDAKGNRVAEHAEDSALKQAAAGVDSFSASDSDEAQPAMSDRDAFSAQDCAFSAQAFSAQAFSAQAGAKQALKQAAAAAAEGKARGLDGSPLGGDGGDGAPVPAPQRTQVDEKSHDDMVMSLQNKVEMERQMQRLAMAHFAFWHFWFLFIPSAALTMASGVLAFLSTSEAIEEGNRTLLVTVVGCLALVATFLQTLNDLLKYGSRAEMHRSAVLDLKAIYDALDFMQISRIGGTTRHADVTEYQKIYSQVQQGCKSTIPLRVIQSFNTMDTRILSQIPANKKVNFDGKVGLNQLVLTLSNEIYCAIAAYWLFPLALPDPDRIMVLVLKRVHDAIAKDLQPAERSLNIGQLMLLREELPHPRDVQRLAAKKPEPHTALV